MKKISFILIATLSLLKGFAQKVGIGTTTPAFKLDVKMGSINTDSRKLNYNKNNMKN
jgi:hypothetical protein